MTEISDWYWFGWALFGLGGLLISLLGLLEIWLFAQAPCPAIKESEQELGAPMPERRTRFVFMVMRPLLSIAVGLGAVVVSASQFHFYK